jgi:hypothetical protein
LEAGVLGGHLQNLPQPLFAKEGRKESSFFGKEERKESSLLKREILPPFGKGGGKGFYETMSLPLRLLIYISPHPPT